MYRNVDIYKTPKWKNSALVADKGTETERKKIQKLAGKLVFFKNMIRKCLFVRKMNIEEKDLWRVALE